MRACQRHDEGRGIPHGVDVSAAPWDPMPSREWDTARTKLTETGIPWPDALMRHDLRWWASKVRLGYASRIPGARTLAADWGVSRKVAARVMRDEAGWNDPLFAQDEGTTTGRAGATEGPPKGPPEPHQDVTVGKGGQSEGHTGATEGPPEGHRRVDTHHTTPQAQKTPLSNSADAESDPDTLTKTWEALQAIRKRHQPAARGQSFSAARRRNLRARLSELRKAGHDRGALLHAAEWVHTSANMRAEGARKTGDPLGTLLRPRNCLDYVELAIAGNAGPAASATDGADLAWQQILTMTRRGDLAERIRSGRLGADPAEHGRRLAAIRAVGGFPVFRSLDNFTERKTRDGFRAAYAGGAA